MPVKIDYRALRYWVCLVKVSALHCFYRHSSVILHTLPSSPLREGDACFKVLCLYVYFVWIFSHLKQGLCIMLSSWSFVLSRTLSSSPVRGDASFEVLCLPFHFTKCFSTPQAGIQNSLAILLTTQVLRCTPNRQYFLGHTLGSLRALTLALSFISWLAHCYPLPHPATSLWQGCRVDPSLIHWFSVNLGCFGCLVLLPLLHFHPPQSFSFTFLLYCIFLLLGCVIFLACFAFSLLLWMIHLFMFLSPLLFICITAPSVPYLCLSFIMFVSSPLVFLLPVIQQLKYQGTSITIIFIS